MSIDSDAYIQEVLKRYAAAAVESDKCAKEFAASLQEKIDPHPVFVTEEKVRREIRERFALTGKKDD